MWGSGSSPEAKVTTLHVGADDYLVKPMAPSEFIARVAAHLRRSIFQAGVLRCGRITISERDHAAFVDADPIELTRTEFDILKALVRCPETVIGREDLLSAVWGNASIWAARCLDVHMSNLRKKLGAASRQLKTVRGKGFRFDRRPDCRLL